MRGGGVLVGLVVLLGGGACAPTVLVHRVRPGETLAGIAASYGVSLQEVVRLNALDDPDRIRAGRVLRLPTGVRRSARAAGAERATRGRASFEWPVAGAVVGSPFGPRWGRQHDGIDLSAPEGTLVRAARGGRVIYSGWRRGYGNVVVLDHGGGWTTVYAHNQENRVPLGAQVRRGTVIATLGSTGSATGPNLHFEVRKDDVAYDPLWYLPADPARDEVRTRIHGDSDS